MCPVIAAASAAPVLFFATCRSFDLRCVFTRPKPVVLACRESSAPDLVVEDPRQVVNRRNVPGGRRCVRGAGSGLSKSSPAPPFDGSQVALEHPALRARLASGAGRVHLTFAVIAALSRVCTDQMSRNDDSRPDQTTGFDLRKTQRRSKDRQVAKRRIHPADAAATTGHIPRVDNLSRVLDHQIVGNDSRQDKTTGFGLVKTQRRSKDQQVAPASLELAAGLPVCTIEPKAAALALRG
jgi:hypothetical protein